MSVSCCIYLLGEKTFLKANTGKIAKISQFIFNPRNEWSTHHLTLKLSHEAYSKVYMQSKHLNLKAQRKQGTLYIITHMLLISASE